MKLKAKDFTLKTKAKDLSLKAKAKDKDLSLKAKAKDMPHLSLRCLEAKDMTSRTPTLVSAFSVSKNKWHSEWRW